MELQYLETHLVDHCNLNCKGCGHFAPLSKKKFTDFTIFKRDFLRLRQLFDNISVIRLMGGEPLLHPDLIKFLEFVRAAFPDSRILLVTNGTLLLNQSDAFWEKCAINNIIIDITRYPIKLDFKAVGEIGKQFDVKIEECEKSHFEKYLNIAGDSDPALAFRYCQTMYKCYFLQEGKIYICRLPALIHIFNEYFGNNVAVCNEDYIDIHENVTGSDIIEFLNHYTPFCRWCLIGWPIFQWGISKRELNEWLPTESDLLASKVRYNLSFVRELVDSNQFENAMTLIRSVEKELKEPPIEPNWNYLTAFCQHNLQINLHDAINRYNVALEHGYYEFWVRYNRGSLHAQLGNIEQARADLLRAVELNPAHEGAKHVLQQMLRRI